VRGSGEESEESGSGQERIFHGVFAECLPSLWMTRRRRYASSRAFTDALREHVGCADISAGGGLRRRSRHLNTRLPGLDVRDDLFAEMAKGVERLLGAAPTRREG